MVTRPDISCLALKCIQCHHETINGNNSLREGTYVLTIEISIYHIPM